MLSLSEPLQYNSQLLAAALNVPDNAAIVALRFVPDSSQNNPTDAIEHARRRVSSSAPILDALLPSVQLGNNPALYIFCIAQQERIVQAVATLDDLHFDGLTAPSPASHFPFQDIYDCPGHLVSHFLNAARTRLINDLVIAANGSAQRCKDGFLISHQQLTTGTDWGTGWEYKALSRPLIFCYVQLQPARSTLFIRPTLLPTPYLPLDSCLPLPPRSPIILLPYATPAYFLTTYSGPTSALVRQFSDSLQGQGQPALDSSFIIGWIRVENRQGEDKGISFVYPARLCLVFAPSFARPPLDHTPDLPGPLQPSPKLQNATTTPLSEVPLSYPHRPSLLASPTTELKAFRALTLSKARNIRTVAAQVSGYVDHVAKDRERERERLKREREGGKASSPNLLPRNTPSSSTVALPSTPSSAPAPLTTHIPTPSQPTIPSQNFYPSPPQAESSAVPVPGNTSPVLSVTQQQPTQSPTSNPSQAQVAPSLTASSSSSSYDPFGYLGNMTDIGMDFGMDMSMSFNMGMGMSLSGNTNTGPSGPGGRSGYDDSTSRSIGLGGGSSMDFADLTDDDFNFFDQPSSHAPISAPPPAASSVASVSNAMQVTPPPFSEMDLSGPGPPHPTAHLQSVPATHTPWTSNFPEGFTPLSIEHLDSIVPPDLIPPSPGTTPLDVTERGAATPNVHLEQENRTPTNAQSGDETQRNFGPIPFAKYHRVADGKYAPAGKFGLPSPPPDEPDVPVEMGHSTHHRSPLIRRSPSTRGESTAPASWRTQYNAATDPRVGVMRKLIGVKRKHTTQGGRTGKSIRKSPWTMEYEEWKIPRSTSAIDAEELGSELSEDEEVTQSESDDEFSEEEDTPVTSRPSTPPPSYLPLGPTLLHTQFHHAHLLPLSKPLRPPDSSIAGSGAHGALGVMAMPIANVPTPVSPAAGLGLTAEKWRALEVVVNMLAKEAVENAVWGETWLASNAFSPTSNKSTHEGKKPTEIWASDVKFVERLFGTLEDVQGQVTVSDVFGLVSTNTLPPTPSNTGTQVLQPMHMPKISAGKGDAIISILPTALRFWEKLGLGPKSGEKDATVFLLLADDGDQHRQDDAESWLASVCTAYESKHLGKLTLGVGSHCVKDGIVPLRFDLAFRKVFATFATSLAIIPTPVVLFLVVPFAFMSLSSPVFRQILSSMQKALKSLPKDRFFVQLVPEHVINYMENNPACTNQLEVFCINLYNRILVPVDRPLARSFLSDDVRIPDRAYLQKAIFTLARPTLNKVTYARSAHTSLDVLDRYTLLHVGYRITPCGKWLVAACLDQRGEGWDQGVWLVKNDQPDADGEGQGGGASTPASASGSGVGSSLEEGFVVRKVWDFVVGFARKADIEWRIVVSKLGIVDEAELTAWTEFLPTTVPTCGLGSVQVSLFCADPDNPWMFTKLNTSALSQLNATNNGSKSLNGKNTLFSDASSTTYALFPSITLPIAVPPTPTDLGLSLPYVVDPSNGSNSPGDNDAETTANSPTATPNTVTTIATTPLSPSVPKSPTSTGSCPHAVGLLPKSTTCLVRVPCSPPFTSTSMLHIHLLYTYCYPPSMAGKSAALEPKILHADVTKSFYELSVLANSWWKMASASDGDTFGSNTGAAGTSGRSIGGNRKNGINPILPIHLAMVDIMSQVADGAESVEVDS